MPDRPEDRLVSFRDAGEGAAPAGAPAARDVATARARRRRSLLAGGLAVAVLAGGGLVVAQVAAPDAGPDVALPPPSAAPTADPSGTPTPTVTPAPSPPSDGPPAQVPSGAGAELASLMVDLTEVAGSDAPFADVGPMSTDLFPYRPGDASVLLLDPCRPTAYPTDGLRTEVLRRDQLQVEPDGDPVPEGAYVQQLVARYPTAATAQEAFAGFRRVVEACPTHGDVAADDGTGGSGVTELVERPGPDSFLAQSTPTTGLATSYVAVVRAGEVVTLATLSPGETRDADALGRAFAQAVADRLAAAG